MGYRVKKANNGTNTRKQNRKAKRKARKAARQAKRPGMFAQFKDERQQHRQNASPLRKAAGVIPAIQAGSILMKELRRKQ
tara:strand:- start:8979 stop:9218 length:240 start_codon:yes stop_codon:yes gene_type:complete